MLHVIFDSDDSNNKCQVADVTRIQYNLKYG